MKERFASKRSLIMHFFIFYFVTCTQSQTPINMTSPWSSSGTNIYYNGGNVGIGTDAPAFPLNFGNTYGDKVSFWGNSGNHYGIGVQTHVLQIHTDAVGSDISFGFGRSGALTELMRLKGNGNLGIGINNPLNKLEVAGKIKADEFVLSTTTAGNINYRSFSGSTVGAMTGIRNTNMGLDAGRAAAAGTNNANVGAGAGDGNTDGSFNSNFGSNSGMKNITGSNNTNIGASAGYANNGKYNVNVGFNAGGTSNNVTMRTKDGNVSIGVNAGAGLSNYDHSVFIGYNAGVTFSSSNDIESGSSTHKGVAGRSVFVLNNQAYIEHPLLFGVFGQQTRLDDPYSSFVPKTMCQLGVNTHELVDSCALTVAGAVHIGPNDHDPNTFDYDNMVKDYLLWVERGVVSEDFIIRKVASWNVGDWSDYVFDDKYPLLNLKDLKEYITKNKHLPNVLSKDDVAKSKGYSIAQMDQQLLRKVEELTLYTIQQQEQLESQKKQIDGLMKEVKMITARSNEK